jgi:hypothetical protein
MSAEPTGGNQRRTEPVPPTPAHTSAPSAAPGSAPEVPVPSREAAELTSEASPPVSGVAMPAVAPPAHADGETDTRMPPTASY